jgi:LCP family protein required for cell wall assembly
LLLVNSILVIACIGAAGVFNFIRTKAESLPVVDIGSEARQRPDLSGPRNFLLVGTDNSDSLAKGDPVKKGRNQGEHLADVIMILRVDPATKEASLLSIPRDTWVPIAPSWSKSKINSAFGGNDGPNTLVATIKHNFGISIDNYVQVDFGGFRDLVEVLGGLTVFNTHPIRDPATGLYLPLTGCIYVEPTQALAYARSRHLEYQNTDVYAKGAKWIQDPTGDLGRITRQQDFLRQAAQRAIDEGIRNPSTAIGLVNAGIESVQTDNDLNAGQIVDLISTFRDFSVENLKAEQIPTKGSGSKGVSYQEVIWGEAEGLLDIYRGIRADGDVVPADVIVGLPPAVATSAELALQLDAAGFDAGVEDSSVVAGGKKGSAKGTVIRFGIRGIEAARVLASHLDGAVTYEFSATLPGRRLELIPGTVPPQLLDTPTPIDQVPVPSIVEQKNGRGSTTTSSTSTTVVGRSSTTIPPVSTPTSVDSVTTTSTLNQDVTTTTAIGVNTFDAKAATSCPGS